MTKRALLFVLAICVFASTVHTQENRGLGGSLTPGELGASLQMLPIPNAPCTGANLLLSVCTGGSLCEDSAYGLPQWNNMTAAIDASFATVTTTTELEELGFMLGFDALWIDHRGYDHASVDYLSAGEMANISAFIDSGRRVVMIGENEAWTIWNNQLMSIVGGGFSGADCSSTTAAVVFPHEITEGVSNVRPICVGLASGGTPFLDVPFVTLWGAQQNVVTILDENAESDGGWTLLDNARFFTNIAEWLGCGEIIPVELESFEIEK